VTREAAIRHHQLVTREQLWAVADRTGILASSIEVDDRDNTYVFKVEDGRWVVFEPVIDTDVARSVRHPC
jgi:hypothetical protein